MSQSRLMSTQKWQQALLSRVFALESSSKFSWSNSVVWSQEHSLFRWGPFFQKYICLAYLARSRSSGGWGSNTLIQKGERQAFQFRSNSPWKCICMCRMSISAHILVQKFKKVAFTKWTCGKAQSCIKDSSATAGPGPQGAVSETQLSTLTIPMV